MAAPTIVGVGVADSATPWAPTVAGPVLTNDVILLLVEQTGGEVAPSATGYAHIDSVSPVVQGNTTQLSVMWLRSSAGGETSVTVTGPTNHAMTRTITIRGCKTTGNPWNAVAPAVEASSSSCTWPGVTTTVAECLVCEAISTGTDTTATQFAALITNSNYTSIAKQMDNWTTQGQGGGIALFTGIKASAGATGQSTGTLATAATKALMTLALEPAPLAVSTRRFEKHYPQYRR